MATETKKLHFPQIEHVELKHFSLYSLEPTISVDISSGVFCLAGANGLGKSTFLSAINYGLTGIPSGLDIKFDSFEDYYKDSKRTAENFYDGRIKEWDRKAAEISLKFSIDRRKFVLTRGMFEPEELRSLRVLDNGSDPTQVFDEFDDLSGNDLNEKYKKMFTRNVGLNSFEQYLFLQHFVFTFDERRHLLFWDKRVLERTLYLAFGIDYAIVDKADRLNNEINDADSRARNAQYAGSQIRKRVNELEKMRTKTSSSNDNDKDGSRNLDEEHKNLTEEFDKQTEIVTRKRERLSDANMKLAELSSQQVALRRRYEEEFSERIRQRSNIRTHPLITSTLASHRCEVCGNEGEHVVQNINKYIDDSLCPFCQSRVDTQAVNEEDFEYLQKLDFSLQENQKELSGVFETIKRTEFELRKEEAALEDVRSDLEKFEKLNSQLLSELQDKARGNDFDAVLEAYKNQIEEFEKDKGKHYKIRDRKRSELEPIQKQIERQYIAAEETFVPLFQELAHLFLGLDLQILMESSKSRGLNLVLRVDGNERREAQELSESQRFFLDIALRMAFAQYMSVSSSKASFLIDTPEGSLDIAYESRAGEMFAKFVENGHDIIMTANINSSQLLKRLAEICSVSRMQLYRMTSWTHLSEVQLAEEELFNRAYDEIEGFLTHNV